MEGIEIKLFKTKLFVDLSVSTYWTDKRLAEYGIVSKDLLEGRYLDIDEYYRIVRLEESRR